MGFTHRAKKLIAVTREKRCERTQSEGETARPARLTVGARSDHVLETGREGKKR